MVQYNMILHTSLQELRQDTNQRLNPQKTLSYVNILEKINPEFDLEGVFEF